MRQAQRTGRRDLYEAALHHAYAFADIGIDHADYTQQICAMPKGSISLVLQRNLGMLTAYLETGDPYLLRVAESMADVACAIDRGNWPRRSYGRDAAWIRSLNRLYDVTGQTFYLQRAGEACHRLVQCQHADGSFSDQGGATGAHGHLNEIIKPWMNSILSEVMVDYLERAGRDPAVEAALVRVADWLLTQLIEDEDGPYWPYQVAWGRNENDPTTVYHANGAVHPHPTGDVQLDYNARTLLWVSRFTGDPRYGRAWPTHLRAPHGADRAHRQSVSQLLRRGEDCGQLPLARGASLGRALGRRACDFRPVPRAPRRRARSDGRAARRVDAAGTADGGWGGNRRIKKSSFCHLCVICR